MAMAVTMQVMTALVLSDDRIDLLFLHNFAEQVVPVCGKLHCRLYRLLDRWMVLSFGQDVGIMATWTLRTIVP